MRHSTPLLGTFATHGENRQRWFPEDQEKLWFGRGHWTHELIGDAARRHASQSPEAAAVIDQNGVVTYADLEAHVAHLAAVWAGLGISAGDRAIIQLQNSRWPIEIFLSLQRLGAVPVMAVPGHREHDLLAFVDQSDARLLVADAARGRMIQRLSSERPDLHVIAVGETDVAEHSIDTLLQETTDRIDQPPHIRSTDLALLQLSGGSTGIPKLIPRTHADYLYSVRESARICALTSRSVYLCALPATHNFAVSSPGWLGIMEPGGTVVMASDPSARRVFPLIAEHRVTITGVVPPVVMLWLEALELNTHDLSSLEVIQVGGAKLSEEVARRIIPSFRCRLQQVFGMAEGLVNYTRLGDPEEMVVTTQGRPISPDDEILIVDDDDVPVQPGESGHLLTRGPYTIRGYLATPEYNSATFTQQGFYRTGDIVRMAGPNLQVTGRSKDQINRGGEKIAPEEVENLLLSHTSVLEACVVGIPDQLLGERIKAHIVLRPGHEIDVRDLRRHLMDKGIASFKMPDVFQFDTSLPRTAIGKTANMKLRLADSPDGPG